MAYVGNISFDATPDDLKAVFAETGVDKACCAASNSSLLPYLSLADMCAIHSP